MELIKTALNFGKCLVTWNERRVDSSVMRYLNRIGAAQGNYADENEFPSAIGETLETALKSFERLERDRRIERIRQRIYLAGKVNPPSR